MAEIIVAAKEEELTELDRLFARFQLALFQPHEVQNVASSESDFPQFLHCIACLFSMN